MNYLGAEPARYRDFVRFADEAEAPVAAAEEVEGGTAGWVPVAGAGW